MANLRVKPVELIVDSPKRNRGFARHLSARSDDLDYSSRRIANQLFRSIATSAARVLRAPLDDGGDVSLLCVVKHGERPFR
jgi:hypothetical protein